MDPNIDLKSIFITCLLKSLVAHLLRVKVEPNSLDVSLANSKLTSHVVFNLFFNQSFFPMIQWPLIKNTFSTSLKPGIISVVNWVILSIHSANICLKPPVYTTVGKHSAWHACSRRSSGWQQEALNVT